MNEFKERFLANMDRHPGLTWDEFLGKLDSEKKAALAWMEESGGEPDVVALDSGLAIVDCAKEEPAGRRSVCYDKEARIKRKKFPPETSAEETAKEHGLSLLDEADYRQLQELGDFDLRTSCWIETPAEIREKGGALFAEKRYGTVFVYHNGADSYYKVRGFRAKLIL
ncbi:hypothetical protein ME788_05850 [Lactobacillus delbrueckii]|uniref:DUF4256 domain-containing protein n=1 Tax=Lactobacillus delbrueckii TaxID=1584 RepID=UPI001F27C16D|nr:DUF4256 domain-containing protein [Lactobacillus delbrueckii]GHN24421.1 hypothetical protein ME786_10370 [Lactobacillus delbrueckii]GHN26351.1 hypothetical protein ME787_10660 [Lactobacillus delbrueckii]GHN27773.1 hypothetical protein ME788_05850 [Lactobacillus delbrueckii]